MTQGLNSSPLVHHTCFVRKNFDAIAIAGTTVKCSKTMTFLCALVDDTLSVQQHMAAHAELALSRIHLMQYVRKYLTTVTTKMLMCSLVQSQLDCIMCMIRNTYLRMGKPYKNNLEPSSMNDLKRPKGALQLHWLPITYRCCFQLLTIVYKLYIVGDKYNSVTG